MTDKKDNWVSGLFKRTTGNNAKKITLSPEFYARPLKDQVNYLIKLASSLNHAAQQIQEERDELSKLLFQKDGQLVKYQKQLGQDRGMIQQQLVRENQKRQELLEENQRLRAEIKRLEALNADNDR
jgi:predicted  nucleic acid-binding Zn-ribbon protein